MPNPDSARKQLSLSQTSRLLLLWWRSVHSRDYLAAKAKELGHFATIATAITAFFLIFTWAWDYAIDPSNMPAAFGLRMAETAAVLLLAALMHWRASPRVIRAALVAVPLFVQITFIEILGRLDGGSSYGIGGFLYFFIFVPFMALAESLRFRMALLALVALLPNVLRLVGLGEHLNLAVFNAYVWMVYIPMVMIMALVEHLIHSNIFSRRELEQRATTDPLTGTGNRLHFAEVAERVFQGCRRLGQPVSVLFVDADHFKDLNDRHGHAYGDRVLRALAKRIRSVIREADIMARYGGEEFVILLPNTGETAANETAERVREHIRAEPLQAEGTAEVLTVSVGVATSAVATSLRELLAAADAALYEAKRQGRDRVVISSIDQ